MYIARSEWLRDKVRERVIAEAEQATGGKVEVARFRFDWKTVTAEFDGLVIHGTEPAGSPPLLSVEKAVVRLRVVSLMRNDFNVASAAVDTPRAYLLIARDGSTNIPQPKIARKNTKSAAETILDLKVGEFAVVHGSLEIHPSGEPPRLVAYDFQGRDLRTNFSYEAARQRYEGSVSATPIDLRYGGYRPVQIRAAAALAIEKNLVAISEASLDSPESHIQFSGTMTGFSTPVFTAQYHAHVSVRELGDLVGWKSPQSGAMELAGDLRYVNAADFRFAGDLHGRQISFTEGQAKIHDARIDSHFAADPKTIGLSGLSVSALGGQITGRAELQDLDRFSISGTLAKFQASTLAAFATEGKLPYDGIVSGPFDAKGQLHDAGNRHLEASGKLSISPANGGAPLQGLLDFSYRGASGEFVLARSFLALPHTRVEASGIWGESLRVEAESTDTADLLPLTGLEPIPVSLRQGGSVRFDGTVEGPLTVPQISGHVAGRNIVYRGQTIESVSADVTARENGVTVRSGNLSYKGLLANVGGSVSLNKWKLQDGSALNSNATLRNASVASLLALVGKRNILASGTLNATVQIAGTVGNPQAAANFTVTNGSAYEEPFDRASGRLEYSKDGTEIGTFQARAGAKTIDLTASYRHALNDLETGQLHFQVSSNRMAIGQLARVRRYEPGLNGMAAFTANGDIALSKGMPKLVALDANANATGVALNALQLGDVKLSARTTGQTLKTNFTSNLAGAGIDGEGSWQMAGDYPGTAHLKFNDVNLATARKLLLPATGTRSFDITGSTEGTATLSGPLLKPETMTAEIEIPRFEVRPEPVSGTSAALLNKELSDLTVRNTQPIRIHLANSIVSVESARFTAPNTDVSLVGTINLRDKNALNLNMNGNVNLKLARTFNADIDSSGSLLVRVTLRGPLTQPKLGGTADLRGGNISAAGVPNGLSNANGRIAFDENRATIETMTAQTGGGSIKLDGFAAFGGPFTSFRLGAVAKGVRVRYPEGISSVSDANLSWTGTTERSLLSGDVTVHKVSYNPQADLGAVLSLTAGPTPTASSPTGVLGGTQFDLRVQTAPDISFQTGLLTGLQTEANLRLRGTAANPALLGRIVVNSGTLSFFGNKYVINEGTISFFNPVKIEPVLNVDLQTRARGVDVTLTVTGPLSKLGVTYRSDPPLQFSDVVALLATGKTPSDPTIAARQTDTQQSWQELGASALVGQAISNPVSGRLQRFFGVSKLKIDPLLPGLGGAGSRTGGSSPGARVSVEQQITPNVTFDYVISTNSTSSQIVRVEWAFSKHWSAVILREENSAFGVDFQYKKRFK